MNVELIKDTKTGFENKDDNEKTEDGREDTNQLLLDTREGRNVSFVVKTNSFIEYINCSFII